MLHVSRPAATTGAADVALLGGRTVTAFIDDGAPVSPGVAGFGVVFAVA